MKYGRLLCAATLLIACTNGDSENTKNTQNNGETPDECNDSNDSKTTIPEPNETDESTSDEKTDKADDKDDDGKDDDDDDRGADKDADAPGDSEEPATSQEVPPIQEVDILVMVDDSGSMAQEQVRLERQLHALVGSLAAGNRAFPAGPMSDAVRFTPVQSVHIGVITSNLGRPPGVMTIASPNCNDDNGATAGGNGALQSSGEIASHDIVDMSAMQVVRPGDPACESVNIAPAYLAFGEGAGEVDPMEVAARDKSLADFSCIATRGTTGCGIEQPLEAIWKALAPESVKDFVGPDTRGQATRANAGFLRPESTVVVLMLSDEDDCTVSAAGTGIFERNGEPYVGVRCQILKDIPSQDTGVQPIARYVDGLLSLRKDHPERVIYAAIAGFPQNGADLTRPKALLQHPRMKVELDPVSNGKDLQGVCGADSVGGKAYPGRRYAELADAFAAAGGSFLLQSICDESYGAIRDGLVAKIAAANGMP